MAPVFTIKDVQFSTRRVVLALPFQFGSTTVTEAKEAHLTVELEGAGGRVTGYGAQMMIPRWFDKRADLSNDDTVAELMATLEAAQRNAVGLAGTIRALSVELRDAVSATMPDDCPALAAGFGPALVEMAAIDAACRSSGVPFVKAAQSDLFGLSQDAPKDVSADTIIKVLREIAPRQSIAMRHTVGYDAPLTREDVSAHPGDGRPVALTDVIVATGISAFKIKLKGDPQADLSRLKRLAAILDPLGTYRATLDANEQYSEAAFNVFVDQFLSDAALTALARATLFVEQPFPREVALTQRERPLSFGVPLVIDESDDGDDALPRALASGWAGTSVKSCKGVLRALLNKARVEARRAEGKVALLSAEDLTCQPGLSWQQDTMMAACVGASHVERNGHHFAGGMQGASADEKAAFVAAHGTLYAADKGGVRLIITDGAADLSSLFGAGFASTPLGT
ncbi:MAG: mandelate racemase [Pseudomonadota bacterium]